MKNTKTTQDDTAKAKQANVTEEADGTLTLHGAYATSIEARAARRGMTSSEYVTEALRSLMDHQEERKPVRISGMIAAGLIRKARAHAKARGETLDQFATRAVTNFLEDEAKKRRVA
jgi:hypothetical protein